MRLVFEDIKRGELPASAFVFPERRAWPIPDEEHGRIALSYIARELGDSEDWPVVRAEVLKRYPGLAAEAQRLGV